VDQLDTAVHEIERIIRAAAIPIREQKGHAKTMV
jgi:hypothetical protein